MSKPFERKKLFLTYPQFKHMMQGSACNPCILEELTEIITKADRHLVKYVVAHERHKDGASHYHVYLELDSPIKSRNPRLFDVSGNHPNI
jgi:hypothetical protein